MDGNSATKSGAMPLPGSCICSQCAHYRLRPKYQLFSSLQAPGVLRAKTEFNQQERQRAEQEAQRLAAGLPFDYEPHHYAWCAKFTPIDLCKRANGGDTDAMELLRKQGGAVLDPVTGKISALYAVCADLNPTGQCRDYEPKPVEPSTLGTPRQ